MNNAYARQGKRKSYKTRVLTSSVSRRKAAGGKANKKHKFVGTFRSDLAR